MRRSFPEQYLAEITLVVGLLIGLGGCSFQADDFNVITVINNTAEPLVVWATEEPSGPVDPNPALSMNAVRSDQKKFVTGAGTSVTLNREDIKGAYTSDQTLWVFLYEVRGDTAFYKTIEQFTYDELAQRDFRIEISALP